MDAWLLAAENRLSGTVSREKKMLLLNQVHKEICPVVNVDTVNNCKRIKNRDMSMLNIF